MSLAYWADVLVEVVRRVRKGGEDNDFLVAGVNGMGDLLVDQVKQLSELAVMRRGNVGHHEKQLLQRFCVRFQVAQPGQIVHIGQIDLDLAANAEKVGVLVIGISVLGCRQVVQFQHLPAGLVVLAGSDGIRDQFVDVFQREAEGRDRAFQPLEQVDAHQTADALLAALPGRQAVAFVVGPLHIFVQPCQVDAVGLPEAAGQIMETQLPLWIVLRRSSRTVLVRLSRNNIVVPVPDDAVYLVFIILQSPTKTNCKDAVTVPYQRSS